MILTFWKRTMEIDAFDSIWGPQTIGNHLTMPWQDQLHAQKADFPKSQHKQHYNSPCTTINYIPLEHLLKHYKFVAFVTIS